MTQKVYPSPEERALRIPLHEYGIVPRESLPFLRRRIAEEIQAAIQDAEEWTTEMRTEAEREAFNRVPATCQDVADVLGVLAERYEITDEDVDFARKMIKRLATGRLREALIESIGREQGDTLTNGCGVDLKIQMSGASVRILFDPNRAAINTADNGVSFHKREG